MTVNYVAAFDWWCLVQAARIKRTDWRVMVGRTVGVGM